MTLVGVNVRRTVGLLLSVVLLFGATTMIASHSADAAYPGGNDWIVFVDTAGDSGVAAHLWAMRSDGSDLTQLTNTLNFDADPAFSADGAQIAFARDEAGSSSIYVADFLDGDTSSPSLDTPTKISSGTRDGSPTWAPAGTEVAYHRRIVSTITGGVPAAAATEDNAGILLTDDDATFIADGVSVGDTVLNLDDGSSALVTGRTATTIAMADGLAGGTNDDWEIDDLYEVQRSHRQIFVSPTDGSNLPGFELSPAGSELLYDDQEPVWSPDGLKIAFTSTRDASNSDIFVFDAADGDNRTNLTTVGTLDAVASHPAWAPDGSRIAFQIAEEEGQPSVGHLNIWTITPTGTSPIMVTSSTDNEVEPAWSPDGSLIAFRNPDAASDDANKVFAIASDGTGSATRVGSATTPANANEPDWQPILVAVDDTASVDEHGSVVIDVVANDLTLVNAVGIAVTSSTLVTQPTLGTVSRDISGTFTYEHTGPEIGTSSVADTFVYTVTQGSSSSIAEVTVTIDPFDDDPVGVADVYAADHAGTLTVNAASGVLSNDSDPEGGGLSADLVDDVSHGTLDLEADGSFEYVNDGLSEAAVVDTFTYTASDGSNDSAVTTVTINVGSEDPNPPLVTISGPSFGAPGVEANFTSAVADGSGPKVYTWTVSHNGSDIDTDSGTTFDFTPTLTGLHTVSLMVTDSAGTDTDTFEFRVMTDIEGVFVNDIVWLANEGITKGCNPPVNDTFCTNDYVTRGQMAAFLVRFLGLTDNGGGDLFEDDNGSIFEENIDRLATAGITKGCNPGEGNTNFCPSSYVTRGQMAAFLHRADALK
ncbi:MAG: hypothetical protein GY722_10595 [bacterium]|nr:hypothetical protein [bacterium]